MGARRDEERTAAPAPKGGAEHERAEREVSERERHAQDLAALRARFERDHVELLALRRERVALQALLAQLEGMLTQVRREADVQAQVVRRLASALMAERKRGDALTAHLVRLHRLLREAGPGHGAPRQA